MPTISSSRKQVLRRRYSNSAIQCPLYLDVEIATLGEFFSVFSWALCPSAIAWFRGLPSKSFRLAPSALRYPTLDERNAALSLVTEMRRFLESKLDRPPASTDKLAWIQVAQHYGLPTRLLDWTQNAAVALFFACSQGPTTDGLVVILNPIALNQAVARRAPRIFNMHSDSSIIEPYLSLDGAQRRSGLPTIAINPTWNTERIAMQQGVFTLHGSKKFELDQTQAASLVAVPILREHKLSLFEELHRVGIGEMFVYPEPEHVCAHLKRVARL